MQFYSSDWLSHDGIWVILLLSKYGNCTRLFKVKHKLKIGCFYK